MAKAAVLDKKSKQVGLSQEELIERIEDAPNTGEFLKKLIGERVFIICVRYSYRGILAQVGDDYLVLSHSAAVEQMGSATSEKPAQEDNIGSWVMISLDAVEIVFQPTCVDYVLPGE